MTFLGHLSKRAEDMRQRWATLAIASGRGEPAASFPPWALPQCNAAEGGRRRHDPRRSPRWLTVLVLKRTITRWLRTTAGTTYWATLEPISVPSYAIDREGTIRWLNAAARGLFGDLLGRQFTSAVAPEYVPRAREEFARKLLGTPVTDFEIELVDVQGRHVLADVSSVPLRNDHRVVGVFGLVQPVRLQERTGPCRPLTPRQAEVLRLLAQGASTHQIASVLHLSRETVRNHIRHILRSLGAHSRLEALAIARRAGLLD
jgi:PAS domain S-box-containing protein